MDGWTDRQVDGRIAVSLNAPPLLRGGILVINITVCVTVYTGFALCEYIVVASNIGFHWTCAAFDLRLFSFAIQRAS